MYILGINDGHLATAALLKDGEIMSSVSEERFSNIKNQPGIPVQAIKFCLRYAKITPKDIDLIIFGGKVIPPTPREGETTSELMSRVYRAIKPGLTVVRLLSLKLPSLRTLEELSYPFFANMFVPSIQKKRIKDLCHHFSFDTNKIQFLDHHLAHAITALYSSGQIRKNRPLLILTCDGEGDSFSATVNIFQDNRLSTVSKTSMTNSLGNLYRSTTTYLGMKPLEHEYKVMGLAAYVKDSKANELYAKIKHLVKVDKATLQIKTAVNSQLFKLGYLDTFFGGYRFDYIAAAVQRLTQNVLINWTKASIIKTGIPTVLLSGGVFMNVKANQKIAELPELKNLFIMPSCGDESNAIGAAYWGYTQLSAKKPKALNNLYLGEEFDNTEIKKTISSYNRKNSWKITKHQNIELKIAKLLAQGEIVARFSGRGEWGARALGNRSILADASNLKVIGEINKMIKSRDFWMPFAPVIMKPHQDKYIKRPKDITAPYMIITFDTTLRGKQDLAAAMHQYDKTVRPQVIDKDTNPSYYQILSEFSKITGRYGLLNTSFNLHGSPIVGNPHTALYTFDNSRLKYLAIGNFLIKKV